MRFWHQNVKHLVLEELVYSTIFYCDTPIFLRNTYVGAHPLFPEKHL